MIVLPFWNLNLTSTESSTESSTEWTCTEINLLCVVERKREKGYHDVVLSHAVQWNVLFYRFSHSSTAPLEQIKVQCLARGHIDRSLTLLAQVFEPATFRLLAQRSNHLANSHPRQGVSIMKCRKAREVERAGGMVREPREKCEQGVDWIFTARVQITGSNHR